MGMGMLGFWMEKDSGCWARRGSEQRQCQKLSEGQKRAVKVRLRSRDHLRKHQSQSRGTERWKLKRLMKREYEKETRRWGSEGSAAYRENPWVWNEKQILPEGQQPVGGRSSCWGRQFPLFWSMLSKLSRAIWLLQRLLLKGVCWSAKRSNMVVFHIVN